MLKNKCPMLQQAAEKDDRRHGFENVIHPLEGNAGGYDAWDGREERIAFQLC